MSHENKDLFELYFEYVRDTEPPLIYHRWSLIAAVGAFLGRRYYMPFGDGRIFPNQYVMLIGNPGTRKSTAIKTSKKLLSSAGYDMFAAEKTTKEKFLQDLAGMDENEHLNYRATGSRSKPVTATDVLQSLNLGAGGANSLNSSAVMKTSFGIPS